MKKQIFLSAITAIVFSVITIAGYQMVDDNDKTIQIQHLSNAPSSQVLYSMDENGKLTTLDFNETAEKVIHGVVHIKSTHMYEGNSRSFEYRQLPDPFKDFFGDDFNRFFNPRPRNGTPERIPENQPMKVGTGSGVIISEDGYIITNNHVVSEADDIEVTLHDNRTFKARVIGTDPSTDLALLQIKAEDLPVVPFVNSDEVNIGQWVLAVGNPMGLTSTVTAGIVSAKGRNININRDRYAIENFIQTDAAINPGNSGGALVNLSGGLIGINTAIASPTGTFAGYGFAVPANIAQKVVEDLITYGTVQRGVLGIMIRSLDGNLAKEKDLDLTVGVYVDSLMENSAAGEAGVEVGDVITAVNGKNVKTSPELQGIIAQYRPGEKVTLLIDRNGKMKTLDVILNNRDGNKELASADTREVIKILGAELENVEAELAEELKIDGGVKVKKLYPGKLRKYTQMREGFIITKIDGKKIKDVDALVEYLENKEGGVMMEGVYEDVPGSYYYAFGMDRFNN
ncbi:MAG: Do family serine endopeptidase [Saprospiraceae bacterium]|nr:Do family serine endopeptidase [Saprospiraceae bacterium]